MIKLIRKHQFGGGLNTDDLGYFVPVYGTYKSIKDAYNNPSLGNISMAGLSALGDIGTIFGVGALAKSGVAAVKAGTRGKKAYNAYKLAQRKYATKVGEELGTQKYLTKSRNYSNKALDAYNKSKNSQKLAQNELNYINDVLMDTPKYHLQNMVWQSMPILPMQMPHILTGTKALVSTNKN